MGGVDKPALTLGGTTLLERVLAAAFPVAERVIVVGPSRPTKLPGVEFVSERTPGGGPVPAVLAAARLIRDDQLVVVLAADLPFLTPDLLVRLMGPLLDPESEYDAAAAIGEEGRPNPLLAAYRAACLWRAAGELGSGEGLAAARLLPPAVAVVDLPPPATFNVNTPDDLREAERLITRPGDHRSTRSWSYP